MHIDSCDLTSLYYYNLSLSNPPTCTRLQVLVTQLQFDGQMIPARKWGQDMAVEKLELTPEEEDMQEKARGVWSAILSGQVIEDGTDFFKCGAGSMDVTR